MSKKSHASPPASTRKTNDLVIGLTGPVGSGCSSMASVLEAEGFKRYKVSDAIRQELVAMGKKAEKPLENWRKKLQDHGDKRRKERVSYWVDKVAERIREDKLGDSPIVIDGVRNFGEVLALRETFPNFFLVAICAERQNRWPRVAKDYEGRQSEFERDDRRDQNEGFDSGQTVQKCVDDADFVYFNNAQHFVLVRGAERPDTTKINHDLQRQLNDFVPLMQGKSDGRAPTPEEVQMAVAYALSNQSSCLKRHVGAVITIMHEDRELPISMGYNENPAGVRRCVDNGGCFKDEHMHSWFLAQGKVYCPQCAAAILEPTEETRCKCGDSLIDWLRPTRGMELCTALHAEERAVRSLGDRPAKGSKLYVTTFPCFQCARLILDARIKELVYVEAYPGIEAQKFLVENGVTVKPFNGFTARAFFRVFRRVS